MESDIIFEKYFKEIIHPYINKLNFKPVVLNDNWIYPTYLYENNNTLFKNEHKTLYEYVHGVYDTEHY